MLRVLKGSNLIWQSYKKSHEGVDCGWWMDGRLFVKFKDQSEPINKIFQL